MAESLVAVGFGILGLTSSSFRCFSWSRSGRSAACRPGLNLFRDHPIVWRTYGLAIGIFVFSLTAMLAIGSHPEIPVILPAR